MECNPFIIVYAVLQFIAFMLVVVGTALDMFRLQTREDFGDRPCLTLWGLKPNCDTIVYSLSTEERFSLCPLAMKRFHIAQIIAVVSVGVYGAAFVFGAIMLYCCVYLRWLCLVLNIVGCAILPVPLFFMLQVYKTNENYLCPKLKDDYDLGVGFFLFAAASCLDLLNVLVLLIPWHCKNVTISEEFKEGSDHSKDDIDHSKEGSTHSKDDIDHSKEGSTHSKENGPYSKEGNSQEE